jgi:hypothetical protein
MNKFYDIIIAQHLEYEQYNKFLQEKQHELAEKRKENAKVIEQIAKTGQTPDEANIQNISYKIYDYHAEEVLYKQDCQSLFYTLYLNVKTYLQLENLMILPKEIVDLCKTFEHTLPKPYFIVEKEEDKLVAKEIEVGRADKQKDFFKSNEVRNIQQQIKNTLEAELAKKKE